MKMPNASIAIGGQTYELPTVTTEQYLEYCDVREPMRCFWECSTLPQRIFAYLTIGSMSSQFAKSVPRESIRHW